jgi:cytochrome P450
VGSSVFAYRGFLPSHRIQYLVADADGARALFTKVKDFCKPVEDYKVLSFFGENVVASEHETWRRHRRLTVGSFSEVSRYHPTTARSLLGRG